MANNSQEPNASRKEGMTKGQMVDTAADLAEHFSKDEPKVIHCAACHEAEKQGKFAKAATVFSLGALVLSAVSLGMQLLREPTSIFESEQWEEMKDLIEKIPSQASSSSSTQANVSSSSSTRIVTIPYVPPAASSKSSAAAMPSSTPQSSVEAVAVTSSRPPSSISSAQSSVPSSVAVNSAESSVTKPVETSSAAPADAGGAAEPAVTGSRI